MLSQPGNNIERNFTKDEQSTQQLDCNVLVPDNSTLSVE